jgi:lipopolysaccharide assembly outer membrane protein LptD (OstA)
MSPRRTAPSFVPKLYFFLISCILIIILNPIFLIAQAGLELIHADKQVTKEVNGESLNMFEGNVHFCQDTLEMYCNDAVHYEKKNKLEFRGAVKITDGHRRLQANKIDYFTKERIAYCYNRVRIKTPSDSLYAEYLKYNFKTDEAEAEKNIYIYNADNDVQIWGQHGIYNPNIKHNRIRDNARFMKVDTSSGDTLNITAVQLEYFGGEDKKAVATDSVTILQGSLKAICDSAIYNTETELVSLFDSPFAWYEDSRLSGKYMEAQFDSLKLKDIIVKEDAKAVSIVDSMNTKENILTGNKIHFTIESNKPKIVTAIDNATSIYYLQTEDKRDQGCNYATSDTILVYFVKGKLDSIAIKGGAEGIYYPNEFTGKKVFENEQ